MYKPETIGGPSDAVESQGSSGQTGGKEQPQEREGLHLDAAVGKLLEGKAKYSFRFVSNRFLWPTNLLIWVRYLIN